MERGQDSGGQPTKPIEIAKPIDGPGPIGETGFENLVAAAYRELRQMAAGLLHGQQNGRTLQPTALVHEAYLRLCQGDTAWENRAHFFGAAARAMRQVLVEYARRRMAEKRGGEARRVTFHDLQVKSPEPGVDLLELDTALSALGEVGSRFTHVVELRYFAGCTLEEIAELTGCSLATVKRDMTYARAWLHDYMQSGVGPPHRGG
ncbi:MAG: sigma-70 family RNA polymerase sigma factor [Bryobacterales bacterium]|nr:sigma-70 family RNA polymerase sigma factor [Bryobacterales bacterium]